MPVKTRLSIDNGQSDCTPAEAIARVGLDALVNAMDDDTRERVHAAGDFSPEEFIAEYLKYDSLIVG